MPNIGGAEESVSSVARVMSICLASYVLAAAGLLETPDS